MILRFSMPRKLQGFRSAVGVVLYLACDLIECAYTIRGPAQFMSSPSERSWTMLKHLCLYLTSVRDHSLRLRVSENGLWHSPTNDDGVVLELFPDSDWASRSMTTCVNKTTISMPLRSWQLHLKMDSISLQLSQRLKVSSVLIRLVVLMWKTWELHLNLEVQKTWPCG